MIEAVLCTNAMNQKIILSFQGIKKFAKFKLDDVDIGKVLMWKKSFRFKIFDFEDKSI